MDVVAAAIALYLVSLALSSCWRGSLPYLHMWKLHWKCGSILRVPNPIIDPCRNQPRLIRDTYNTWIGPLTTAFQYKFLTIGRLIRSWCLRGGRWLSSYNCWPTECLRLISGVYAAAQHSLIAVGKRKRIGHLQPIVQRRVSSTNCTSCFAVLRAFLSEWGRMR